MAPSKSNKKILMEIDGQVLRRSARIANLQDTTKKVVVLSPVPTVSKVSQKKIASQKRAKETKTQLTQQCYDFESMKINDLFKLVKIHTPNEVDRTIYYNVLQRVVRNTSKLAIRNRVKEMYDRRSSVMAFVCSCLHLSFETVDDMFDTILCYQEVKDAQMRHTMNNLDSDLDLLIQSIATIKI
jgi:hypothetical protein